MSAADPGITCIYFSDSTVVGFLKTAAGHGLVGGLLVECGLRPSLNFMLNVGLPRVRMPISSAAGWSNMVPLSRPFTIANPAGLVKAGRRTTDDG